MSKLLLRGENSQNVQEQSNNVDVESHGSEDVIINGVLVLLVSDDQLCVVDNIESHHEGSEAAVQVVEESKQLDRVELRLTRSG